MKPTGRPIVSPKYEPVFIQEKLRKRELYKTRTRSACVAIGTLSVCTTILIIIYFIVILPALNFNSCYEYGCYNSHRAEMYSRVPEDNITIPNIKLITTIDTEVKNFKLVCYFNFPDTIDAGQLQVNELDPKLCTHINAGFAGVVNNSIYMEDSKKVGLRKIIELKKFNRDLKILLCVGGSGAEGFSPMVKNHTTRKTFIQSILSYVKTYKIDGIDLDWEFPNEIGTNTKERMHFTQLLHEIREEINRQRKHRFLISVAVPAPYFIALNSYDINYIKDYVDYVNIMTYDFYFYTKLTPFTGINSPLYSLPHDVGIFGTLNINYSVNFWLSQGMPKEKIIIGLPTYGHTYKLINSRNNGISAPAIGFGDFGHEGFIDYGEVCSFMYENGVVPNFDEVSKSPYATFKYQWVSFDDARSLTYKAEYIKTNNFGGAMVYCLNSDDYKGQCNTQFYGNRTKFPLIQTIREVLINPEY